MFFVNLITVNFSCYWKLQINVTFFCCFYCSSPFFSLQRFISFSPMPNGASECLKRSSVWIKEKNQLQWNSVLLYRTWLWPVDSADLWIKAILLLLLKTIFLLCDKLLLLPWNVKGRMPEEGNQRTGKVYLNKKNG